MQTADPAGLGAHPLTLPRVMPYNALFRRETTKDIDTRLCENRVISPSSLVPLQVPLGQSGLTPVDWNDFFSSS
jgi:hypothetical protein